MKKKLYLACFLVITFVVSSIFVTLVNNFTSPIIEQQNTGKETAAFKVIDEKAKFSETEFEDETGFINKAFIGESDNGKYYIFNVNVTGFNTASLIDFNVGFDSDGKIIYYDVVNQQETEGIGSKITTTEFVDGVINKGLNDEISTISGATVSSSAVLKGITAAKKSYAKLADLKVDIAEVKVELKINKDSRELSKDFGKFDAVCEFKEADSEGNNVFSCNAKGYGLIDPDDHGIADNYSRNEATIVLDSTNSEVVSVTLDKFGDTPNIGDKATDAQYLESLISKKLEDNVDTVTGATWTSDSILAMVNKALSEGK